MAATGTTSIDQTGDISVQQAGILNWLKDHIIDPVASIFNPFEWLAKAEHSFTNGVMTQVSKALMMENKSPGDNDITQYLYGNAIGITPLIIAGVIIVLLVAAQFIQRKIATLGQALLITAVLGALTPVWFELTHTLLQAGRDLSQAANWYHGKGNVLAVPDFASVLGGVFGYTSMLILAMILIVLVFVYPLIAVAATTAGLPSLALSSAGDRANKWFGRAVSLLFVSMFIGIPVAIAFLNLGKAMADHGPLGNTTTGQLLYLNAALILAIVSQFALLKGTSRVYARASGQVRSNVRGKVEATLRQKQQVQINNVRAAHAGTMSAAAGSVPKQRQGGSSLKTALTGVALSKAANLHPAAGAAIKVGQATREGVRATKQRSQGSGK